MDAVLIVVNGVALLAVVAFIAQYSMVRWERTPEGRNAMAVSAVVLLLVVAGFMRRLDAIHDLIVLTAYASTATVFVWRSLLLIRAQRDQKRRAEKQRLLLLDPDDPKE